MSKKNSQHKLSGNGNSIIGNAINLLSEGSKLSSIPSQLLNDGSLGLSDVMLPDLENQSKNSVQDENWSKESNLLRKRDKKLSKKLKDDRSSLNQTISLDNESLWAIQNLTNALKEQTKAISELINYAKSQKHENLKQTFLENEESKSQEENNEEYLRVI